MKQKEEWLIKQQKSTGGMEDWNTTIFRKPNFQSQGYRFDIDKRRSNLKRETRISIQILKINIFFTVSFFLFLRLFQKIIHLTFSVTLQLRFCFINAFFLKAGGKSIIIGYNYEMSQYIHKQNQE